ncbi:MAG: hypothetical protein H6969_10320 [Gammaproteobacteria bacterium]|nr:hypothetical protein [Gammaproteobacteria bacterium]
MNDDRLRKSAQRLGQSQILHPLSTAQLGLWYGQSVDGNHASFYIAEYVEILGPMDPVRFEKALRQVVTENDALRLRIVETDEGPRQYLADRPASVLSFQDVSEEPNPQAAAEHWMHADLARRMDLTCELPFRYALLKVSSKRYFWYALYHHLCNDGFGMALIARRVAEIYSASSDPLPSTKPAQWFGLLADEHAYTQSSHYQRDRQFWQACLAERSEPITLSGKPPTYGSAVIRCTAELAPPGRATIESIGKVYGASFAQVIMSAVALFLYKHSGQQTVSLGIPVTTRTSNLRRQIAGMVSNFIPLLLNIKPDSRLSDLLPQVSQRLRQALQHQRYRGEDLRRDFGLGPTDPELFGP